MLMSYIPVRPGPLALCRRPSRGRDQKRGGVIGQAGPKND